MFTLQPTICFILQEVATPDADKPNEGFVGKVIFSLSEWTFCTMLFILRLIYYEYQMKATAHFLLLLFNYFLGVKIYNFHLFVC